VYTITAVRAGKSEEERLKIIFKRMIVRLVNVHFQTGMADSFPCKEREFFRFFVFSFFWSFRALWHTRPSSGETENEEGGQKTKNYLFFIFTKSLFLEGQTFVEGNAFFASF